MSELDLRLTTNLGMLGGCLSSSSGRVWSVHMFQGLYEACLPSPATLHDPEIILRASESHLQTVLSGVFQAPVQMSRNYGSIHCTLYK